LKRLFGRSGTGFELINRAKFDRENSGTRQGQTMTILNEQRLTTIASLKPDSRQRPTFPTVLCGWLPRCKCEVMIWPLVGCSRLSGLLMQSVDY
jgi:hypothetical protein